MNTSLGEASRWLLREQARGPWVASLRVQALVAAGAPITIDSTWSGVVTSAVIMGDDTEVEVIAGQGKLAELTAAKQYHGGATTGAVAADLCAAAGEVAAGDESDLRGTWRARGGPLSAELSRLSPPWYIAADGKVRLQRGAPPTAVLGGRLTARGEAVTYQANDVAPLVGASVDGRTIETVLYRGGGGVNPRVTLWPARPSVAADPSIVAGTMTSLANGRAGIDLDNGEQLTDVPLFCAAGFLPEGASQVRVLVLDVAGDGANTIAITGVDGRIDGATIGNIGEVGTLLRSGDLMSVQGLVSAAPGSPVVSPPGAVRIVLDPIVANVFGPPGAGASRVKG
jgi:hypothetical protein